MGPGCAMRVYCVTEDRLDRVRSGNREMGYEELGSCSNIQVGSGWDRGDGEFYGFGGVLVEWWFLWL